MRGISSVRGRVRGWVRGCVRDACAYMCGGGGGGEITGIVSCSIASYSRMDQQAIREGLSGGSEVGG